jgi:hypothetical protein
LLEWRTTSAVRMHLIIVAASFSVYYPLCLIWSNNSLPFKCSIIKWILLSDSNIS